jgi:acetyl-CoA synthetase
MKWEPIRKPRTTKVVAPNLPDYAKAVREFSWLQARLELTGLPDGAGLNIAHEAVDRHLQGPAKGKIAFHWLGKDGDRSDISYGELAASSNQFANALAGLGVQSGGRVFVLTGRIPELYVTFLGTLKHRAIFCPLFSAFGPEPIKARLHIGQANVLVTTAALYAKKVAGIADDLPDLQYIILIGESAKPITDPRVRYWHEIVPPASDQYVIGPTDPEDPALLHFTSGTTGTPKGALHVHQAVLAHYTTGKLALDLHGDDIFWCTADPGWVTGTSYGIIAPLTNGVTSIIDEADFDAERWYGILQDERVTVWYTAPTAIRSMMRAGTDLVKQFNLSHLRFMASVGEPLNPEAVVWGVEAFGLPFHDNWWQTETGGIMVSNYASMDIRPGSMGKPLPGIEAVIVEQQPDGGIRPIEQPNVQGELALCAGWPSMFRAYWNEPERYKKCFVGDYYLTGDLARRDEDGYFWFVGRKDDVIKTSGHLIGPFEVESTLMEHPAVAEVGVIGKPDPVAMEIVKAFVVLKPGQKASNALLRELMGFGRVRLGAVVAPKEIAFVDALPKTRSGKVLRRLLKARELGLPEGDTSTLESGAS